MKMILTKVTKGKRFGVRKYAIVAGDHGQSYIVTKIRKRGTRSYYYNCTCPDHVFRLRTCKHIKKFIANEIRLRQKEKRSK